MYRFGSDLDLSHLIGAEVSQVLIVPFNLTFVLHPKNHINLCGKWRIRGESGDIVDEGDCEKPKEAYRAHVLLSKKLIGWSIPGPSLLAINFEGGFSLEVIDDSDLYECCAISPNIYI